MHKILKHWTPKTFLILIFNNKHQLKIEETNRNVLI